MDIKINKGMTIQELDRDAIVPTTKQLFSMTYDVFAQDHTNMGQAIETEHAYWIVHREKQAVISVSKSATDNRPSVIFVPIIISVHRHNGIISREHSRMEIEILYDQAAEEIPSNVTATALNIGDFRKARR